jgi:hypothetical protein
MQVVFVVTSYAHKFALVRRTLLVLEQMSELHNKDDNQIPLRTFFMMIANNPVTLMVMYPKK